MKRRLLRSRAFIRSARRSVKKNPQLAQALSRTLEELSDDVFQPHLRSHKLKGPLAGRWAASVGFDMRIVFRFVEYKGEEAILLLAMGTHDEVY